MSRQFQVVLGAFLILGFVYAALFIGVSKTHGLWNKQGEATSEIPPEEATTVEAPTETPTEAPIAPSNTPTDTLTDAPTDTLVPTGTPSPTDTPSYTPTDTFTKTYTPTRTETEVPTDTVPPGYPTSTPIPPKILPLMNTASATATEQMIAAPLMASSTPTSTRTSTPRPKNDNGSNDPITTFFQSSSIPNVNITPYLVLLAVTAVEVAAFWVYAFRGPKVENPPPIKGGWAAFKTMTVAIGSPGFEAWMTGQAPILTPGEKAVLTKLGDGMQSAVNLAGGISDLKNISETGTEAFFQLTVSSPFLAWTSRVAGLVQRKATSG